MIVQASQAEIKYAGAFVTPEGRSAMLLQLVSPEVIERSVQYASLLSGRSGSDRYCCTVCVVNSVHFPDGYVRIGLES